MMSKARCYLTFSRYVGSVEQHRCVVDGSWRESHTEALTLAFDAFSVAVSHELLPVVFWRWGGFDLAFPLAAPYRTSVYC